MAHSSICHFLRPSNLGLLLFIIASAPLLKSADEPFTIEPPPNWVALWSEPFEEPDKVSNGASEGVSYLLIDKQLHAEKSQRYWRIVTRIENFKGVQSEGHQNIYFDPSYQTLAIHQIDIIRDGQRLSRLDKDKIKVIQQETDLEMHLYDESLTALAILEDLRVGDTLDVAYTVTGMNPALQGAFVATYTFEYSVPVNQIHYRLLIDSDRKITIAKDARTPPTQSEMFNGETRYLWEAKNVRTVFHDDMTPSSFDVYAKIYVSEFESWKDVVDWALPLYESALENQSPLLDDPSVPEICSNLSAPMPDRIRAAIEFVQDEIRYFGMEIGPSSLIPHNVEDVISRRFGDCKDKSILLVGILREMGVQAWPVLISTIHRQSLLDLSPSPYAFNHATVLITLENGEDLYVDPTYNFQRGKLEDRYYPNYRYGLPIKAQQEDLQEIPIRNPQLSTTEIEERFMVTLIDEPVRLYLYSKYVGRFADQQRDYINSTSQENIERNYSDFYSKHYDGITLGETIEINDDQEQNRIAISEGYSIARPWEYSNDSKSRSIGTRAFVIDSALSFPKGRDKRDTPLSLAYPYNIKKTTSFDMPRVWEIEEKEDVIENDYFYFSRYVHSKGKTITVNYIFESKADEVPAGNIGNYLDDAYSVDALLQYKVVDDISNPIDNINNPYVTDSAIIVRQTRPFLLMSVSMAIIVAWSIFPGWIQKRAASVHSKDLAKWRISIARIGSFALLGVALIVAIIDFSSWYSLKTVGREQIQSGEAFILLVGLLFRIGVATIIIRLLLRKLIDAVYAKAICNISRIYLCISMTMLIVQFSTSLEAFQITWVNLVEIAVTTTMTALSTLLVQGPSKKQGPPPLNQDG